MHLFCIVRSVYVVIFQNGCKKYSVTKRLQKQWWILNMLIVIYCIFERNDIAIILTIKFDQTFCLIVSCVKISFYLGAGVMTYLEDGEDEAKCIFRVLSHVRGGAVDGKELGWKHRAGPICV